MTRESLEVPPEVEPRSAPSMGWIAGAAVVIGVLIVVASVLYFRHYAAQSRAEIHAQLESMAELKVEQIVLWRGERISDAMVFHHNRHFAELADRALGDGEDDDLLEWLDHVQTAYGYDRIALLDDRGAERFVVPRARTSPRRHAAADAQDAIEAGEIAFRDFHRDAEGEPPHLTVLVPLYRAADGEPLGALAIRIDPEKRLYPMLRAWPTPRRTAETVLVRRDGDSAVVLNELRSRENAALDLRIPLARSRVPAAMAARGVQGIVEGLDPDGEEVVASIVVVPDTPWFLVARLDTAEAYGPIHERLAWTVGLVVVLFLGLGGVIGLLWQRRQRLHYESLARAEASVRRKQEMLERTERIANVGSWEWDPATDTATWSDEMFRIFGLDPSDEPPRLDDLAGRMPAEDFARLRELVDRALEDGAPYESELRVRRPDGDVRHCLATGRVETGSDGEAVRLYGSFQDLTERKRAEDERERLRARLARTQRMESVGQLAGGVAHDFNNMLSVILGRIELALDRIDPSDPIHEGLRDARDAGRRSAELTRQLLGYARRQPVAPQVVDLNETIENMLAMLDSLIGEDVPLSVNLADDLGLVEIDPGQVDQILTNLLINARDAIEGVGEVVIETRNVVVDRLDERAREMEAGDYVTLVVSDDGVGMEPEELEKIFDPFFTTKALGEGTGLGLATVYGIVKQNGGTIHAYSEVGRGTTFRIYLPRIEGERRTEEEPAEEILRGRGETVLVVEDEDAVLRLITRILDKLEYTVLPSSSPTEAVRMAERHAGEFDLVLTDVVMPEMNGPDLVERIRANDPDVGVVYMSGYTAEILADDVLHEGAEFVQKPPATRDLAAALRRALEPSAD